MSLAPLLVLALAACGGDDEPSSETTASTGEQQTQAETQAQTVPAGDDEETQARGTLEAFVTAIDDADEDVFCGIVSDELLDSVEQGLTVAECLEKLKGTEFARSLKGAKVQSVAVSGDAAAGTLALERGTFVGVVMRKPEDRWLVHRFEKP